MLSGTPLRFSVAQVGAARQAAFLGVPAIATSLADYTDSMEAIEGAVQATLVVVEEAIELLADYGAEQQPRNFPRRWGVSTVATTLPVQVGADGEGEVAPAEEQTNGGSVATVAACTELTVHEQVRRAFVAGDCLLNINVPSEVG